MAPFARAATVHRSFIDFLDEVISEFHRTSSFTIPNRITVFPVLHCRRCRRHHFHPLGHQHRAGSATATSTSTSITRAALCVPCGIRRSGARRVPTAVCGGRAGILSPPRIGKPQDQRSPTPVRVRKRRAGDAGTVPGFYPVLPHSRGGRPPHKRVTSGGLLLSVR